MNNVCGVRASKHATESGRLDKFETRRLSTLQNLWAAAKQNAPSKPLSPIIVCIRLLIGGGLHRKHSFVVLSDIAGVVHVEDEAIDKASAMSCALIVYDVIRSSKKQITFIVVVSRSKYKRLATILKYFKCQSSYAYLLASPLMLLMRSLPLLCPALWSSTMKYVYVKNKSLPLLSLLITIASIRFRYSAWCFKINDHNKHNAWALSMKMTSSLRVTILRVCIRNQIMTI